MHRSIILGQLMDPFIRSRSLHGLPSCTVSGYCRSKPIEIAINEFMLRWWQRAPSTPLPPVWWSAEMEGKKFYPFCPKVVPDESCQTRRLAGIGVSSVCVLVCVSVSPSSFLSLSLSLSLTRFYPPFLTLTSCTAIMKHLSAVSLVWIVLSVVLFCFFPSCTRHLRALAAHPATCHGWCLSLSTVQRPALRPVNASFRFGVTCSARCGTQMLLPLRHRGVGKGW